MSRRVSLPHGSCDCIMFKRNKTQHSGYDALQRTCPSYWNDDVNTRAPSLSMLTNLQYQWHGIPSLSLCRSSWLSPYQKKKEKERETLLHKVKLHNYNLQLTSHHHISVEAIPIYVEELLLQLTCWVECTTWDDSSSWSRAVILYKRCPLFIYNK